MLKRVSTILSPAVFPQDEDKTRKARYAHVIAFAFLVIVIAFETIVRIFANYTKLAFLDMILIGFAASCVTGLVLLRRGYVRFTSILLVVLVWVASNGIAATGFGARDASYLVNFAIILMAGLLLGWQASLIVTLISIISGFALAYAERSGLIVTVSYPITSFVRDITFVFGLNGVLIYLLINGLENALRKSRVSLNELESANINLNFTQSELQNRTAELITANKQLENRTKKLRAVAEVTRTATSIPDFDLLLPSITSIISDQLGYYHVGVFLLDKQSQYAILRSANTDGGLRMLKRGYRVPVGQLERVSSVAQTGQPRIALDIGEDAVFFNNPDLPETRSQMVLPLKSGDQIIGVLDIQSTEGNAFTEEDISILSVLADQVAITVQNALLYEQSQMALHQAEISSSQASGQAWKVYIETIQTKGYRYDGIRPEALKDTYQSDIGDNALSIPVQLRGQTIGSLKLKASDNSRQWTDDELAMIEATAERVSLAVEGVRLLEDAQKRAARETFLSDMAAKLSTSFQLDSILRDTVEELGQTLKNSTISFQLVNPSSPVTAASEKSNGESARRKDPD
jgi:GAF domain-containing protein